MLVYENKGILTCSLYPDTNWTEEKAYVVPDGSELANKIMEHVPYFDFVLDDEGNLIDITPTERPEPEQPSPAELREQAYETEPLIEWEGTMITVDQANDLWLKYSAEGSPIANELSALIVEAKAKIREQYPDKE